MLTRCIECRTLSVVGNRPGRPRSPRGRTADAAGHVERLGHPNLVRKPSRLQSALVPEWIGVAPRQRHHRPRLSPLRIRYRGCAHRPRHQRSGEVLHIASGARALRRDSPRPDQLSRPVSRRKRPASLGSRICVCFLANDFPVFSRTRPTKGSSSILCCRTGCRISNSPIFESEWKSLTSASGEMARGPGGKCSREIRAPSSLAAAPAGVSCRSKPAVASTARFQICHATPRLLCQ